MTAEQIYNVMTLFSSLILFISLGISLNLIFICAKIKEAGVKQLEVMILSLSILLTLFYAVRCYM